MEPLAASSAGAVIRPAAATVHTELSAVLREGRVLAGEVLQSQGDGTLLIAIGRHRVPAETRLLLEEGHHFLFRVEHEEGEIVLRILGTGDPSVSRLLEALRGVVGEDRPVGELLHDLAARIRAEIEKPGSPVAELRALEEVLARHVPGPGDDGEALLRLLGRSGLRYEATLAAALRSGVSAEVLENLSHDLKAQLLRAFEKLEDGPLRETLGKTLAGIEAEQLLNVARQRAGEPLVWSLPFPDVDGWTTARLVVSRRRDDERTRSGGPPAEPQADIVLGVRFSNLGPIRAELSMDARRLAVRVLVTRPELVGTLQTDFDELAQRLGGGQRTVHLFTRLARPEEVEVAESPLDIRFLREHRLMDVSG